MSNVDLWVLASFHAKINASWSSEVAVRGSNCTVNSKTFCAALQYFWVLDVRYSYWSPLSQECIFRMECHGRVPVWSQCSRRGAPSKAFWELKLSGSPWAWPDRKCICRYWTASEPLEITTLYLDILWFFLSVRYFHCSEIRLWDHVYLTYKAGMASRPRFKLSND